MEAAGERDSVYRRAAGQSRQIGAKSKGCAKTVGFSGHQHRLCRARSPGLLQGSYRLASVQQAGNLMFEVCQAITRKIRSHGNDDIACLRKLFSVQSESLAKQPLYAVAPYGAADLALHTDAQTTIGAAIGREDDTKPLAMPPCPFLVDLLKFTIQMQAHPAGKGATAGHGVMVPVACDPWPFFF